MTKKNQTNFLGKIRRLVERLLAISWIRNSYVRLTAGVLAIFASNRLLATIYSIPGFITFNREQYAVLKGRREYYKNLNEHQKSKVELRRSVHRIEKGLTMRPKKDVFAKSYIEDAANTYQKAVNQYAQDASSFDETELEWAHNVFGDFFKSVKPGTSKPVDSARHTYSQTLEAFTPNQNNKKPFLHKDKVSSNIAYEDFLNLTLQRRSVRWFKNKKVPRELIDKALLAARQSPTACNRLPYKFNIYDRPGLVKEVADIPFGAAGYSHQIPTIIVVIGELNSYSSPRDRHAIYIDASLAAMSFMFALETLGASSSAINWPDFEPLEAKMQKQLKLSASQRVVMLIAVGYGNPDGKIPYSQKKSLDNLRVYNQEVK